MNCRLLQRHVATWLDGELDPGTQVEFERHVDACAACQELVAFERSFSAQLSSAIAHDPVSGEMTDRWFDALDGVRVDSEPWFRFRRLGWREAWPAAAAAVALLVVASVMRLPDTEVQGASTLPDVLQLHSLQLPSDVESEEPKHVEQFIQSKLGYRVQPARFQSQQARLRGARVSVVGRERVPALYYDVGGQRVTIVVTRGRNLHRSARRRHVGGREVLYHHVGTSTVPILRHNGLNYVVWGDVDPETLFQLVASARVNR